MADRRGSRDSGGCGRGLTCPDGAADPASAQVSAVLSRGVPLVRAHAAGSGAGHRPHARHTDRLQAGLELRGVPAPSGRDDDRHRLLALLDGQAELGGQVAARASAAVIARLGGDPAGQSLVQIPLFLVPAACWWTRQTVESTLMSQVIRSLASAWAWSWVKICCPMPSRCRRRNRSYSRPHGPYRSGTSRHGVPARVRTRGPLPEPTGMPAPSPSADSPATDGRDGHRTPRHRGPSPAQSDPHRGRAAPHLGREEGETGTARRCRPRPEPLPRTDRAGRRKMGLGRAC